MNETERSIYRLLRGWRGLYEEKQEFEKRTDLSQQQRQERTERISEALSHLEGWMRLLTNDERFVVKRHLVDGVSWKRIECEYNTRLRRSVTKSLSSLRRIQRRALEKIARQADTRDIALKNWDEILGRVRDL